VPTKTPRTQIPTEATIRKERLVLEARRDGATLEEAARIAGYTDPSAARKAEQRGLRRTLQQPADELRAMVGVRLEALLMAQWPAALAGDVKATNAARSILADVRNLWGLDHSHGIAEKTLALSERSGELLIAGMTGFLAELGLADDARARGAAAAMFNRLHLALELESGVVDVDPDPPPRKRGARKTPVKTPARRPTRQRVTATRLDKET